MKYRLSPDQVRKIDQLARSNFGQLLFEILTEREEFLNEQFRRTLPEAFQQVQGRALEIEALIDALKAKA